MICLANLANDTLSNRLYWWSSAWYARNGDRATSIVTGVGGLITAAVVAQ
jgi:hypothetical protein